MPKFQFYLPVETDLTRVQRKAKANIGLNNELN